MMAWVLIMVSLSSSPRAVRAPAPQRSEWAPIKPATDVGPGFVRYVTTDAVYVNRGTADGLKVSGTVSIARGSKTIATCEIVQVAEHSAICHARGVRNGDRVLVDRLSVAPLSAAPSLPSPASLAQAREAVVAMPWSLVDFDSGAAGQRADGSRLRVSLSHRYFSDFGAARGPFQLEQVDAYIHQKLGAGLAVTADASLLVWSRRPDGSRNPRTTIAQPVVRQVELSWEPSSLPLVVRVGRVRPRFVTGIGALDGAQLGFRRAESELGVYGGLLPDAVTTGVSLGQWAAGAYGMTRLIDGVGASAIVFQGEARAGWALRPIVGSRFEAGTALHGWLTRSFDLHAEAQFAVAPAQQTPATLDVATLDLGVAPSDRFHAHLSARYRGSELLEAVPTGVQLPTTQSLHASTDLSVQLLPELEATARAGLSWEIHGTLFQSYFGPELAWRPWHGRVGLTAGYQEEVGWLRGRTWLISAAVSPVPRLRVQARGSWFQQPTPALGADEVAVGLTVDARLTSFLVGRLSGSWRTGLPGPQPLEVLSRSAAQAMAQLVIEL